jgi:hypothetical protein
LEMSDQLTRANEIESITTVAAKSFARVLEAEKKAIEGHQLARALHGVLFYDTLDDALDAAPEDLTWQAMGSLEDQQPGSFAILWDRIKEYARDELESGQRAASVAVGDQQPLARARFLVLREKYIREWEPRNVLESQVIDAICQAQTLREYWMKMATERAAVECQLEKLSIEVRGKWRDIEIDGSQSARDAREEAERWDRVFIRAVRALRDLRRYSTAVIVNNQGGQVNVASDGGQQTNVVKKVKKKGAKARGTVPAGGRRIQAVK